MRIRSIAVTRFAPFADAVIQFPRSSTTKSDLQILTGQNGTGKSRLLALMAVASGRPPNRSDLIPLPRPTDVRVLFESADSLFGWKQGLDEYVHISDGAVNDQEWSRGETGIATESGCGRIEDGSGGKLSSVATTHAEIPQFASFAYRGGTGVKDAEIRALAKVQLIDNDALSTFISPEDDSAVLCQSLANLKLEAGMEKLEPQDLANDRAISLLERLESSITTVTGRRFFFQLVTRPELALRVNWGDVSMTFQQLPDGLRCIIGWMASAVSRLNVQFPDHPDPLGIPMILLIDEPETHLHPAWQRKVLPAAQALFPEAQIIVVTHSPFVISSVNEGFIHIFRAGPEGSVSVDSPRECSKGDSWLDAVEDVLGVAEWYDPETEELLTRFRSTRDAVLSGVRDFESLTDQAAEIAARSESLSNLIGREMRQVKRIQDQRASHEKATATAEA